MKTETKLICQNQDVRCIHDGENYHIQTRFIKREVWDDCYIGRGKFKALVQYWHYCRMQQMGK